MALLTCPECEKRISEYAESCPNCGFRLTQETLSKLKDDEEKKRLEHLDRLEKERIEREFFDSFDVIKPRNGGDFHERTIRETKCTCVACGNIWYYGKQDSLESVSASMHNFGKSMMCCTGCASALLIPDAKKIDLNKCPKCGSISIMKEEVIHEVQ